MTFAVRSRLRQDRSDGSSSRVQDEMFQLVLLVAISIGLFIIDQGPAGEGLAM
jgi:hypothetical protein